MENKQTAIEFLMHHISEDQLVKAKSAMEWIQIFEQAKAMHKVEIVNAVDGFPIHARHMDGEEYYYETFGGNNEQQ